MKIKTLFILIMVAMISCQSDPGDQPKKEELKIVLSNYYDAMSKKDIQKMNTLTTTDFVLFDEGVVYNNESAVKAVEQMPAFTATFKFDSLHVNIDKLNASAYYFREASFVIQDSTYAPIKFLESATFKKEDGEWKLRFLHATIRK